MLFTIDTEIDIIRYYRLQESGDWRMVHRRYIPISSSDLVVKTIAEVKTYCRKNQILKINEKEYRANPTGPISLGDRTISFVKPRVHRLTMPHTPKKEDLVEKIAATPMHSGNYSPIITIYGDIDLKKRDRNYDPRNDLTVAARTETLSGDYLGVRAANDRAFVKGLFRSLLGEWLLHLELGLLDTYTDVSENKSEKELLARIDAETQKYSSTPS